MKNPNPKQLDEPCIQYWLNKPKAIYDMIKYAKEKLTSLQCKLANNMEIINNSHTSVTDVVKLIEKIEQIKERMAEKEKSLAQWVYLKWRYEQTLPEIVVFT